MVISASREEHERKREAFRAHLRQFVEAYGLSLLVSNLGRGQGNIPFWHLVVQFPDGNLERVLIPLSSERVDPYSQEALEQITNVLNGSEPAHA